MTKVPIILRPAILADSDALASMWHAGWVVGHTDIVPPALIKFRDLASFHTRIVRDLGSFFVAEQEGATVGFIRIVGNELDQFYVAPAMIGKGIATPLMQAAEDMLKSRGVSEAFLVASVGNDRAVRFYEKLGWTNRGIHQADVTAGEGTFSLDVIRFEKALIS